MRRPGDQQARGGARLRRQRQPPGRREIGSGHHAHHQGRRTRPDRFLDRPQRIDRPGRLNQQQARGIKTKFGKARAMEPAALGSLRRRPAPDDQRRTPASWQPTAFCVTREAREAAHGKTQREADGQRVGSGGATMAGTAG